MAGDGSDSLTDRALGPDLTDHDFTCCSYVGFSCYAIHAIDSNQSQIVSQRINADPSFAHIHTFAMFQQLYCRHHPEAHPEFSQGERNFVPCIVASRVRKINLT